MLDSPWNSKTLENAVAFARGSNELMRRASAPEPEQVEPPLCFPMIDIPTVHCHFEKWMTHLGCAYHVPVPNPSHVAAAAVLLGRKPIEVHETIINQLLSLPDEHLQQHLMTGITLALPPKIDLSLL